jgi:hypothetical protein
MDMMTNGERDAVVRLVRIMSVVARDSEKLKITKSEKKRFQLCDSIRLYCWEITEKIFPVLDLTDAQKTEILEKVICR